MTIEENIFKRAVINFDSLKEYGFYKKGNNWCFEKEFMQGEFRAIVRVDGNGVLSGDVYDVAGDDIYLPIRVDEMAVGFVGEVRAEYEKILTDIRDKCSCLNSFAGKQTNRICEAIYQSYGDKPDFPWEKYPDCGVFRNMNNNKWYVLIMTVDRSKLDDKQRGEVEIINIKLDNNKIVKLLSENGYYPAYHMNKKSWISITLDDTISDSAIMELVEESHSYTYGKKFGNSIKGEWIIPANPDFFDVISAFERSNEITWKQSNNISVGDIVYMYLAVPYSAIMYKCEVIETNIPYYYSDKNLQIKRVMRIKKLQQYDKDFMTLSKLKKYGVNAVRGPRGLPEKLRKMLSSY